MKDVAGVTCTEKNLLPVKAASRQNNYASYVGEENDILVVAGNADYELIISNDIYGQPHCTLYGSMQSAADIE